MIVVDHGTHEYGVDAHCEHVEENLANEKHAHDDDDYRQEVVVERGRDAGEHLDGEDVGEEEECKHAHYGCDEQRGQEEEERGDLVEDEHAQWVAHHDLDYFSSRAAKVKAVDGAEYVGVAVEELQKAFETRYATFTAAYQELDDATHFLSGFCL